MTNSEVHNSHTVHQEVTATTINISANLYASMVHMQLQDTPQQFHVRILSI